MNEYEIQVMRHGSWTNDLGDDYRTYPTAGEATDAMVELAETHGGGTYRIRPVV